MDEYYNRILATIYAALSMVGVPVVPSAHLDDDGMVVIDLFYTVNGQNATLRNVFSPYKAYDPVLIAQWISEELENIRRLTWLN